MSSNGTADGQRRTAIVTGAARGIGHSITLRLAEDGLNVTINDLPDKRQLLEGLAKEIESSHPAKSSGKGPFVHIFVGDVSDSNVVQSMINETVSTFGSLDVMVANAGFMRLQPVNEINEDDYEKVMAVNVRGTMLCFKYASQQMIKQGKGGCLLAASSAAGRKGHAICGSYTMSKFAIRGLVHSAALDLGKFGIRANVYAPGPIETDLTREAALILFKDLPPSAPPPIPLAINRKGTTMDAANLVAFLASPGASFITGQTYGVCGGYHLD